MVLTRASSSRLGTPLASPLPDPSRPSNLLLSNSSNRIGTISARDRVLALRRLSVESSLLSSPTASTSTISSPPSPTSCHQNLALNQFSLINSRLNELPPRSPISPFSINMSSSFQNPISPENDEMKTPVRSRRTPKKGSSSKKNKSTSKLDKTPNSRTTNQTPIPNLNLHTQNQETSSTNEPQLITKETEIDAANSADILTNHSQDNLLEKTKDGDTVDLSKEKKEELEKVQPEIEKSTLPVDTQAQSPPKVTDDQTPTEALTKAAEVVKNLAVDQSQAECITENPLTKSPEENVTQDEPNAPQQPGPEPHVGPDTPKTLEKIDPQLPEADQSNSTKLIVNDPEPTHVGPNHEKETTEILVVVTPSSIVVEEPEAERITEGLVEKTQPATTHEHHMTSSNEEIDMLSPTSLSVIDQPTSSEPPLQTTMCESSTHNTLKLGTSLALDLTDCQSTLVPSLPIISPEDTMEIEEDRDVPKGFVEDEKMMIESDTSGTLDGNTEETISPQISSNLSSVVNGGWTEDIRIDNLCTPTLVGSGSEIDLLHRLPRVDLEFEVDHKYSVDTNRCDKSSLKTGQQKINCSESEESDSDSDSDPNSDSESDSDLSELLNKARNKCEKVVLHEFTDGSDKILFESSSSNKKKSGLARPLILNSLSPLTGSKPTPHSTKPAELPILVKDRFGMMPPPIVPNKKKIENKTAKKMGWHDLPYQEITPEVKREIQAMRLHGTLDPKRFVKGGIEKRLKEPIPDRFRFGHIIPSGQSSSTAKESIPKKRSFVEALIEDEEAKKWAKKKFLNDVQAKGASGGKLFWKNLKQKRQKS